MFTYIPISEGREWSNLFVGILVDSKLEREHVLFVCPNLFESIEIEIMRQWAKERERETEKIRL